MRKISVAIIGWGNVGRGCKRAIQECSDMVLAGVVRRPLSLLQKAPELENTRRVADIKELGKVDVALMCIPSHEIPERVREYQELGICTVDAYDEHQKIISYRRDADIGAKAHNVVSLLGAGWDPGTDSAVRALMRVVSITGHTTTTFGGKKGGRNMGHTAAVKSIVGVKDAVSLIFANGRGNHKRKVYVELLAGADEAKVAKAIQKDSHLAKEPIDIYFVKNINKYNTLDQESEIERTGMEVAQKYEVGGINPEFIANIMVSSARACVTAREKKEFGGYTFIERPLIDFVPGDTLDDKLEGY